MKIILVIIAVFFNFSCLFSQDKWELEKQKDNVSVYLRKAANSNIKETKAFTVINAPMQSICDVIKDGDEYKNWVDQISYSKKLKETGNVTFIYYCLKLPIGFKNRDLVFKTTTENINKTSIKLTVESAWNSYPEQSKYLRIKEAGGYWLLNEVQKGKTEVTYQFHVDPGGNIPSWLVNLFIVDGPFDTMKNLRAKFHKK